MHWTKRNTKMWIYLFLAITCCVSTPSTGVTITGLAGEDIVLSWTLDPQPPSNTVVSVVHPSGGILYTALGSGVISGATDLSKRVINSANTNIDKGYIEFTLKKISLADKGDYKASYAAASQSVSPVGVTLVLYGLTIAAVPSADCVIQWTMYSVLPSDAVVTVTHPSGDALFIVQGSRVMLAGTYVSKRVTNTDNTNMDTEHVEFTMTRIVKEDAGEYKTNYILGNDTISTVGVIIAVLEKPTKPNITEKTPPVAGGTMVLSCSTTSKSVPEGHTLEMRYTWYINDIALPVDERYSVSGSQLTMRNILKTDTNTTVTCKAFENLNMQSDTSDPYTIVVDYAPDVPQLSKSVQGDVNENQPVTLICTTDSVPLSDISIVSLDTTRTNYTAHGTLSNTFTITQVDCLDTGQYMCHASNSIGANSSDAVELNVMCSPRPDYRLVTQRDIYIGEGDNLSITATFIANPRPFLTWMFKMTVADNATTLQNNSDGYRIYENFHHVIYTTQIMKSTVDHGSYGIYILKTSNSSGETELRFNVIAKKSKIEKGDGSVVIGVAVGVVTVFIILVAVTVVVYRKRHRADHNTPANTNIPGEESQNVQSRPSDELLDDNCDTSRNQSQNDENDDIELQEKLLCRETNENNDDIATTNPTTANGDEENGGNDFEEFVQEDVTRNTPQGNSVPDDSHKCTLL